MLIQQLSHLFLSRCLVLQSGLTRLAEAAATSDKLSQQAQVQRSLLAQKQEEADHAMTDIQVGCCLGTVGDYTPHTQ